MHYNQNLSKIAIKANHPPIMRKNATQLALFEAKKSINFSFGML